MEVLAIAVHPDDETLGCGATLLKHSAAGDNIHWLIVTAAMAPEYSDSQIRAQGEQVVTVGKAYGFSSMHWLKQPTTRLDIVPMNEIVGGIRRSVSATRPSVVYIPNRSDVHSDHRVVFDAAMAVLKSFYLAELGVRRVLSCEVPSETEAAPPLAERSFTPNVFVDVSATFERKLQIMSMFPDQVQRGFMPRSIGGIEALGRHRGATIGVRYAEAFMLLRELS